MNSALAIVLGGGGGTRLYPLTHERSKPAVPFGGKHRIIDVPVSNCLNSGVNRIFILTQFNSASLNNHVTETYRFSMFSRGFVSILAAEQTPSAREWFQGTADAVRQVLAHVTPHGFRHAIVLSGDQLYQMDLGAMLAAHEASGAELTVATTPVPAHDATGFGVMQTDAAGRIVRFVEKPPADQLGGLESDTGEDMQAQGRRWLGSMGIYVFDRDALLDLLARDPPFVDFGRDVIPHCVETGHVGSYRFTGYWTDIGTVGSFFAANIELTDPMPRLNLYDADRPVFTRPRMLPPSKVQDSRLDHVVLGQGAILEGCHVERSVVGVRGVVSPGTRLRECVVMGADAYETPEERLAARARGLPTMGIGTDCLLERVIVDKNARIGAGVVITAQSPREDREGEGFAVRDGVVVVRKGAVIPDGTWI